MSCNISKALQWETLSVKAKLDRYLKARELDTSIRLKAYRLAHDPSVLEAITASIDRAAAIATLSIAFNVPNDVLTNALNRKVS